MVIDMKKFSQDSFKKALNSRFTLRLKEGGDITLELVHVSDIKDQGRFESYAIEFIGPKEKFLEQSTYELTHDVLGTHAIFLVPVGEQERGFEYEAIFSHEKNKD